MDRLTRRAADGADGERLWAFFRSAVVARRDALFDDGNLAIETGSATLNKGHVCGKTQLVYMPSSFEVVEGVEDDVETAEPGHAEVGVLDVSMVGNDVDLGIELLRGILGYLRRDDTH